MDHPLPTRGTSTSRARSRRWVALGALALLVALLAACSTVRAFTELDAALKDAGFRSTQVSVGGGDPVVLTVSADAPPGDSAEEAQTKAAEVIWTTFPRRLDAAKITIDGDSRTVTRDQLQEQFGDRPAGLDDQGDLSDDISRVGVGFLIGILLTGLVVVVVAGLTALLVVRRRRRRTGWTAPERRQPWAPPPHLGGPAGAPVPPPAGWGEPQVGGAPPALPTTPPRTGEGPDAADPTESGPSLGPALPPTGAPPDWSAPRPPEPVPVPSLSVREARADARRRGRPARGPRPPKAQTPPGWG